MSEVDQGTRSHQSLARKLALSVLIVAVGGAVLGFGSYSAFTATTSNSGNSLSSGTVAIGDDDSGSALYSMSNADTGDSSTTCIKVTYTGSLDADLKLYISDSLGSLAQYIDLTIWGGTSSDSFPGCSGFVADGSALYTGTLQNFRNTYNSWSNGLSDYPGTSATKWSTNDSVVYKVQVAVQVNNAAQGLTTNSHAITWEARSQ